MPKVIEAILPKVCVWIFMSSVSQTHRVAREKVARKAPDQLSPYAMCKRCNLQQWHSYSFPSIKIFHSKIFYLKSAARNARVKSGENALSKSLCTLAQPQQTTLAPLARQRNIMWHLEFLTDYTAWVKVTTQLGHFSGGCANIVEKNAREEAAYK